MNFTNNILYNFTSYVFAFSVIFFIKFLYLFNYDIINTYPFLSSDSLDYIVESLAVINFFYYDQSIEELPVLRNPLLVTILAINQLITPNGQLLSLLWSLSFFLQFLLLKKILFNFFSTRSFYTDIIIFLFVFFFQINHYKFYVLAENICITFSLLGTYLLFNYIKSKRIIFLFSSSLVFLIGSLGQFYVAIPFILINFIFFIQNMINYFKFKKFNWSYFGLITIITTVLVILYYSVWFLWGQIPHLNRHESIHFLGLIKLKTIQWYLKFWAYYFLPFWPFLFLLFKPFSLKDISFKNTYFISLLIIVISNIILCLSYDWLYDSRFTLIFYPFFVIIFLYISQTFNKNIKFLIILFSLISCFLPASSMSHNIKYELSELNIKFKNNRTVKFFKSKSVDRGYPYLKDNYEKQLIFLESETPYRKKILKYYFSN